MQIRPKILLVTSYWPLPPSSGGHQRVLNIARLLGRIGDLSIAIVHYGTTPEESPRLTRCEFDVQMAVEALPVAPGGGFNQLRHRLRQEFDSTYLVTDGCSISDPDRAALLELMGKQDVVWVHTIVTANICRIGRWPHSVLDTVDVLSDWYQSSVQQEVSPLRRLLNRRLSMIWKKRERHFAERFDVVTVCSERERQQLGGQPGIHVVPNGFSPPAIARRAFAGPPRIGFIGTFGYPPNRAGVEWFAQQVWPTIKRGWPQAELRLVGQGGEGHFAGLGPDISELGWLEDPSEEIGTWAAMIVPIRFGGGTRLKMAEGFARKVPIVATTVGAFGYEVGNGAECLLADDAQEFASACVRLLRDPELGRSLAERAHERFLREWTWDSFEGKVREAVQDCLARGGRLEPDEPAGLQTLRGPGSYSPA